MKEISLENMAIQSRDGKLHLVPFEPPMASYAEARKRVVAMDVAAREALGLGDVEVDRFTPARGVALCVFVSVVFYFFCFFSLPWAVPGSAVYSFWDTSFPGGFEVYKWVVRMIFIPVLGIHIVEVITLDMTRLRKYGVQRGSGLWWSWMGSCFFEGAPAFWRFDKLVEEKREKTAKAQ